MIRHNEVNPSSLSKFSESKDDVRHNSTTKVPSVLTHWIKQPKSSGFEWNKWKESIRCMSACSRYESCPAMKCPLDPAIDSRMSYDADLDGEFKDSQCTMAKATRHKYWVSLPDDLRALLPYEGYFKSEYTRMKSAKERWAALPNEVKTLMRDRLRNARQIKMMPPILYFGSEIRPNLSFQRLKFSRGKIIQSDPCP